MIEIRTSWSKETPPYGSYDDYIIIESNESQKRFLIRPNEFEFLIGQLFDNWKNKKSKYIQILKEWNECIGFEDVDEIPSTIQDIDDTISAIQLVQGSEEIEYGKMSNADLKLLLDFLVSNKNTELKIRKE